MQPNDKICSVCKHTKPYSEFTKDRRQPGGTRSYCKPCEKAMRQKRQRRVTVTQLRQAAPLERAIRTLIRNHPSEFERLWREEVEKDANSEG